MEDIQEIVKPDTWIGAVKGLVQNDPQLAAVQNVILARVFGITLQGFIQILLVIGLVIGLSFLFNWWTNRIIEKAKQADPEGCEGKDRRIATIVSLTGGIFKVLLWFIGLFMILRIFGLDITPILAGAGILGVAFGFGAQSAVKDSIAGFFTLMENNIREGDIVRINGRTGILERLTLRAVYLRDFEGLYHVVPQGEMRDVTNFTFKWGRVVLDIGVAYDSDFQLVETALRNADARFRREHPLAVKLLGDIEVLGVEKLGSSEIVFRAAVKCHPMFRADIRRAMLKMIVEEFRVLKIEIPFSHHVVIQK